MGRLNKHDFKYKKYIQAEKELNKLWEQMRELPYRKLEEPYQSGWILSIKLRDDLARSSAGPIIAGLIEKYGKNGYTRNATDIRKIRRNPSLDSVRTSSIFANQWCPYIRSISKQEYEQLSRREQKYFYYNDKDGWWGYRGHDSKNKYHIDIPSYYLLVKIDKRLITHVQDIDPVLLKKEAELKAILQPYYATFSGYNSWSNYFQNRKERRKNKVELSKINAQGWIDDYGYIFSSAEI